MIIGLSGKISSGKDTAAAMLQEELAKAGLFLAKRQFAGKLKQFVASLIGCTLKQLEMQDFKASTLSSEWNYLVKEIIGYDHGSPLREDVLKDMTVRELLISIGHGLRVNTHDGIWVNGLFSDYNKSCQWVVPDMRYVNEADRILKENGYLIRVERPGIKVIDHPSEKLLDEYKQFHFLVENSGSLDDLRTSIRGVAKQILKIENVQPITHNLD